MGTFYILWAVLTLLMLAVYFNTDSPKTISLVYFEFDGELPNELPSI